MSPTPDSVAIVSGGLDSTTMVYQMLAQGLTPHLLSFDYGQRHKKELEFARRTAFKLGLPHNIIHLADVAKLLGDSGSSLVDSSVDVPEGHYADETMKATVVPNRNMMMLAIAASVAVAKKYNVVATGVHSGDHAIYPDCRPEFTRGMEDLLFTANEGFISPNFELYTPFIDSSKTDIAYLAFELGLPIEETWSCYKGGEYHCGKCGTCVERLEAIEAANGRRVQMDLPTVADQTVYESA